MDDGVLNYFQVLGIVIIFGGFGGIASSIFDNFDTSTDQKVVEHNCRKCNSRFFFRRAVIGVAGTFCAVFLGLWLVKISLESDVQNLLYLTSFCVATGTISFTLLPRLGKKIGEQLLNEKIDEVKRVAEEAVETSNENVQYNNIKGHAITALTTKQKSDIDKAIENLDSIRSKYKRDRTVHIYLGRLYRLKESYDQAITVLREFIREIDFNPDKISASHDLVDKSDAYYNIACYHAVKAKIASNNKPERDRLLSEVYEDFRKSVELWNYNLEYAKTDRDLEWLFEEDERFKELLC